MNKKKNPLSAELLTNMFRTTKSDPLRIINREGTTIEFKESYSHAGMAQYFKTMAAFANNSGGYIIFGVGENPRRLIGLNQDKLRQFEELKVEEVTNNLLDYFSPEIKWSHVTFEFKGMSFGVIYTEELKNKPCICKKNYDDKNPKYTLKESDIYYRYGGRSQRIKYPELKYILEESRDNEQQKWMDFIKRVSKVGIENAGLLDLQTGIIAGCGASVVIDNETLRKIQFIKEGEFSEKKGKPTLRLIGDIENIETGKVILQGKTKKIVKAIELDDIINAFFDDKKVDEPEECIKVICSFALSGYHPIYFLVKQANLDLAEAIEMLQGATIRGMAKDKIIERLKGKYIEPQRITKPGTEVSDKKHEFRNQWIIEKIDVKEKDVKYCVQSILWLTEEEIVVHSKYIKRKLKEIYKTYFETANGTLAGEIRKAICRVDEALYLK